MYMILFLIVIFLFFFLQMAMGPWSYVLLISSVAMLVGVIVQRKLNEIPDLTDKLDEEYDYVIGISISK